MHAAIPFWTEEGHHRRRDTIVFLTMFLLHSLTKPNHQTLYREKTIGEVFWRQWCHEKWTLKTVSEIAFCFILTTEFLRTETRIWFTETILVPIIIVTISSLSLLLAFLLLYCFYCCCLRDCVGVLLAIIICVGVIASAIAVMFVALFLLFHHYFVLFNTYYVSSSFQCYHCYFWIIVISIVLLLQFFCYAC